MAEAALRKVRKIIPVTPARRSGESAIKHRSLKECSESLNADLFAGSFDALTLRGAVSITFTPVNRVNHGVAQIHVLDAGRRFADESIVICMRESLFLH